MGTYLSSLILTPSGGTWSGKSGLGIIPTKWGTWSGKSGLYLPRGMKSRQEMTL